MSASGRFQSRTLTLVRELCVVLEGVGYGFVVCVGGGGGGTMMSSANNLCFNYSWISRFLSL